MSTPSPAPPEPSAGRRVLFRRWHGLEDIDGMAAANDGLRGHIGLLEPVDAAAMRHRYGHLVNSDPARDCILAEVDGATAGYARVEWHDLVDGGRIYDLTTVVAPFAWGLGIATSFLHWGETRSRALAAEVPTDREAWFSNYTFGGDTELGDALEAGGYTAVRWDAELLRPDLEDLPDVVVPDGYTLRTPEADELETVFAMMVVAFRDAWGEAEESDQGYADWVDDPRFRRDLVAVAWDGDRPVAEVAGLLEPMPDGSVRGYVDGVCTHPDHRRRGLARAALAEVLHRFRAAGASAAYLGVDTANQQRAFALYESCGFARASLSTAYRKPFDRTGGGA